MDGPLRDWNWPLIAYVLIAVFWFLVAFRVWNEDRRDLSADPDELGWWARMAMLAPVWPYPAILGLYAVLQHSGGMFGAWVGRVAESFGKTFGAFMFYGTRHKDG